MNIKSSVLATIILVISTSVNAAIVTFSDKLIFQSSTGATSATGSIPDLGLIAGASQALGSVTISLGAGATQLFIGTSGVENVGADWTTVSPGNDIALSNTESINVDFESPVYSAGFDFIEPTNETCRAPCFDSTFTVTLKDGGVIVNSFTFNALDDVLAFVGVWSDTAFDSMEIVDMTATVDNEYYGEFFTGTTSLVPIPATAWLFCSGLMGLVGLARRKA